LTNEQRINSSRYKRLLSDNNVLAAMSDQQQPIAPPPPNPQPKILQVFAHIVSVVFHPVFMPLFMAMVAYRIAPTGFTGITPKQMSLLFLNIGLTTVFFPLFSIALMKPLGFISSYRMPTAKERTIPLMTTMIFYFWVSHVFDSMPGIVPFALKVLLLGNFWGIILIFLINIFTKISMHTATAGGMVGLVIVLMIISPANLTVPFFIALIIAGIIGTARTILGAHQKGDIWLGYIIGIIVQLAAYIYLK
jgi:hypothetical protein